MRWREALGAPARRGPAAASARRPSEAGLRDYDEDLRDSRGCLLEAGGQVDDALATAASRCCVAGQCPICLTTLPGRARAPARRPRPLARRARRLQHPGDHAECLPRRHVARRRVRRAGTRASTARCPSGAGRAGRRARPRRRRGARSCRRAAPRSSSAAAAADALDGVPSSSTSTSTCSTARSSPPSSRRPVASAAGAGRPARRRRRRLRGARDRDHLLSRPRRRARRRGPGRVGLRRRRPPALRTRSP